MTSRYACARQALTVGEPCFGTASQVRRWVLLEQDGPWGRDAVLESRIRPDVGRALKAKVAAVGARLVLIRRHGRPSGEVSRRVFVIGSRHGRGFAESFELASAPELLDIDLSPLADDQRCGGADVDDPLFLVCTNGRHDACCAEFGRPLARALSASHPEQTWECSHIGGDRFAANLVCLPEGVYYGQVGPLDGPRVARTHAEGRITMEHYRGRSTLPFVVQAAEFYVREAHGLVGLDDLVAVRRERGAERAERVAFVAHDGTEFVVELTATPDPDARRLTCNAARPGCPPRYLLHSIETVSPDGNGR